MKYLPKHISYLFSVYLYGLIFFTGFRISLLLTEYHQIRHLPEPVNLLAQAFLMGWRFDTVVSGYALILPLVLLSVTSTFKWESTWLYKSVSAYLIVIYSIGFLICSIDIPFFNYYFSHLTVIIFNWTDDAEFILRMIYEESGYFIYFFFFIIAVFSFAYLVGKLRIHFLENIRLRFHRSAPQYVLRNMTVSVIAIAATFIGIRGRIGEKSPIRTGTAFTSNYAFTNQLGLNPVFTFVRSALDAIRPENKTLHLMGDRSAVENVRKYFKIDSSAHYDSPIARRLIPSVHQKFANIVVVMMENMSASKMGHFGNPDNLTPYLDSLSEISYCFHNIYTAGIHTFNGEFGTLFSYPALLRQHPMNTVVINEYAGFSNTLKKHGYQNIYFTTHDDQFDNVGGFLHANGFQYIVSLKDYPPEKFLSTLGVPDDYMFEFSIPRLNDIHKSGRLFFAAYMTASDHGPFIIPKDIPFRPRQAEIRRQIVEYADWSIGKFMKSASEQEWYPNTIFVFVADHGSASGKNIYDMSLTYHHTPLIIHAPYLPTGRNHFEQIGGQIDIFPTVMGLLNIDYVNNTLGIDLLNESRPYIYFSADDKIGCLDLEYFYVYRDNGIESLYKYREGDVLNHIGEEERKAVSMKRYAFSMMQTAQWLILNRKTGAENM